MGNELDGWRCVTCSKGHPIYEVQPSIDPRWGLSECDNLDCKSRKGSGRSGDHMKHQAPFRRIDAPQASTQTKP